MSATQLKRDGYTVLPVEGMDTAERRGSAREAFRETLRNMPEFCDGKAPGTPWVMGGFAALGNPSSFHNLFVRERRQHAMVAVLPLFREMAKGDGGLRLEQIVDRMLCRLPGQAATAESGHRDEAENADEGDEIFGGWWNLDETPQHLSCVPGTHLNVSGNRGFAKIKDKDEIAAMKRRRVRVAVPPGHILVFSERIVHEVLAKKATAETHRIFLGWRLTRLDTPLIPGLEEMMHQRAVIPLKSGQTPPMYGQMHWTFLRDQIEEFSTQVRDEFKERRTLQTGSERGRQYHIVRRFMPSLADVGDLPEDSRGDAPKRLCGKRYSREELDMHRPGRAWKLARATDGKVMEYSLGEPPA